MYLYFCFIFKHIIIIINPKLLSHDPQTPIIKCLFLLPAYWNISSLQSLYEHTGETFNLIILFRHSPRIR